MTVRHGIASPFDFAALRSGRTGRRLLAMTCENSSRGASNLATWSLRGGANAPTKQSRSVRAVLAFLAFFFASASAHAAVVEEIIQIPIQTKDIYHQAHQHTITVTIWRDADRAKSPFLVLNHGRAGTTEGRARLARSRYPDASRYFVSKGFAVFIPTRTGYGVSGGPDVEFSGPCARRSFPEAFEAGAVQALAVLDYAKAQPYVDRGRGLLVGQSVGGAITVALASKNVAGVVGAINFAGGAGGDPETRPEQPCSEPALRRTFGAYGQTSRVPAVWLYSENDRYWGRDNPRAWHQTFTSAGGTAEFVQLPAFKADGHASFTGNFDAWRPAVDKFLASINFAR